MAGLKFSADIELDKIVKLRTEIKGLKADMMALAGKPNSGNTMKSLERQLDKATKELDKYMKKYALMKKAYEEVLKSDNTVKAVHEETQALQSTNKWIVANTQAVKEADAEIKKLKADFAALNDTEKVGSKGYNILRQVEQQVAVRKREEEAVRANIKAQKEQIIQNNSEEGSITQLRKQLSLMLNLYDNMGRIKRSGNSGKELLAQIRVIQTELNEAEQASGRFQRNVGNYSSAFNGLGMSIQQIARELPAATMGINMFFLAISNNLPIFFDEVQKARKEYAAYIEELKKGNTEVQKVAPVWKQIISGVFSLNTALVVGITLLTAYGKEIFNYLDGLINTKKVTNDLSDVTKVFNEMVNKGTKDAQQDITRLNLLYKAATDVARGQDERNKAVAALQKAYPDYFKNLDAEAIKNGTAQQSYENLAASILRAAQARAVENRIAENRNKAIDLEEQIDKAYEGYEEAQKKLKELIAERDKIDREAMPDLYSAAQINIGAQLGKIHSMENDAAKLRTELYQLNKQSQELANSISAIDLTFNKGNDSNKGAGNRNINALTSQQDKILKQQEHLSEQLLSLRRKNQQDEINLMIDGTEKKLAQIDLDYQKEIDAIKKQKAEWEKAQGGKLTDDQTLLLGERASNAAKGKEKAISEVNKEELEAMNRYLKEYGTFQQKRDAITKEYNNKIAKATTEGDKKMFQKEMEEALSSVDMDKLKQEINWELIFGDLNKVSKKSLEQVKQQLKAFKSSDEYKNMAVDQKKVIDEALNNIQSAIIDKGGLLGDLPEQLDALRIAQDELKQAQDEYNKSLKSGTDAEKEAALKKKNNAEKNVQNAEANVTRSADKTKQNLITLADTITQLGSSSEISLSQIGNIASGLVDAFSEAGSKIGGIIGAVFSLLDGIEKQGFDGFVENIFSSVFRTAASIWDTITFGAFSKITGSGDSDKTLEQDIEYLTQSNQDLKNSLDNLSEKMDKASVTDASDIYEVQRENILKQEANTLEAMQRSAAAYSNGFLGMGGSHSSNNKIDKGISASEWSRVSDIVGKSVSNAGQFFQLSSEQMSKLAEEDTSLYSKIKNLADDGYKNAAQYMDEYITYYKQLEELENAYNEKLTNTSFDNVRNDFKNVLLDMESDAEDFANDFEKMMQNAIVESLMTKKYDKLIQDWYGEFAEAMKSGGKIDEIEQGNLQNRWNSIVNQALAERDALKEMMGWESESDSTREASQRGIATASQDSVDENNGRLAVMQGHTYSINENVNRMATGIDTIAAHTVNLSCLTNIDKTMQSILSMRDASLTHLSNIDSHTARLEAIENAIVFMKNDINTMLIKGLKLSRN